MGRPDSPARTNQKHEWSPTGNSASCFPTGEQRVASVGESGDTLKREGVNDDAVRIFARPSEIKITWMFIFLFLKVRNK